MDTHHEKSVQYFFEQTAKMNQVPQTTAFRFYSTWLTADLITFPSQQCWRIQILFQHCSHAMMMGIVRPMLELRYCTDSNRCFKHWELNKMWLFMNIISWGKHVAGGNRSSTCTRFRKQGAIQLCGCVLELITVQLNCESMSEWLTPLWLCVMGLMMIFAPVFRCSNSKTRTLVHADYSPVNVFSQNHKRSLTETKIQLRSSLLNLCRIGVKARHLHGREVFAGRSRSGICGVRRNARRNADILSLTRNLWVVFRSLDSHRYWMQARNDDLVRKWILERVQVFAPSPNRTLVHTPPIKRGLDEGSNVWHQSFVRNALVRYIRVSWGWNDDIQRAVLCESRDVEQAESMLRKWNIELRMKTEPERIFWLQVATSGFT